MTPLSNYWSSLSSAPNWLSSEECPLSFRCRYPVVNLHRNLVEDRALQTAAEYETTGWFEAVFSAQQTPSFQEVVHGFRFVVSLSLSSWSLSVAKYTSGLQVREEPVKLLAWLFVSIMFPRLLVTFSGSGPQIPSDCCFLFLSLSLSPPLRTAAKFKSNILNLAPAQPLWGLSNIINSGFAGSLHISLCETPSHLPGLCAFHQRQEPRAPWGPEHPWKDLKCRMAIKLLLIRFFNWSLNNPINFGKKNNLHLWYWEWWLAVVVVGGCGGGGGGGIRLLHRFDISLKTLCTLLLNNPPVYEFYGTLCACPPSKRNAIR